jgi:hypothetical protein
MFSQAVFHPSEYENGRNLDDGPILSLCYTLGPAQSLVISRPYDLISLSKEVTKQSEELKFAVSKPVKIVGIVMVGSMDRREPAVAKKLVLKEAEKVLYSLEKPILVTMGDGQETCTIQVPALQVLKPGLIYTLSLKLSARVGLQFLKPEDFPLNPILSSCVSYKRSGKNSAFSFISGLVFSENISLSETYGTSLLSARRTSRTIRPEDWRRGQSSALSRTLKRGRDSLSPSIHQTDGFEGNPDHENSGRSIVRPERKPGDE